MNVILIGLLRPFSILYGWITSFRNLLFDWSIKSSKSFGLPVINVGNITVGGTGKSPHVEYLIRLLQPYYSLATLSRGYGRKTKGYLLANPHSTAEDLGDEPMQFYQKFGHQISVAVSEKRVLGVSELMTGVHPEVIVLDDAFQHRAIKPSLNIVLIDFQRPIFKDFPFPAGRLRENRSGLKRADIIIVSKCPDNFGKAQQQGFVQKLKPYLNEVSPVFFSTIQYGEVTSCIDDWVLQIPNKVVLLSGIAQPQLFENYAKKTFEIIENVVYPDHYSYTKADIEKVLTILEKAETGAKGVLMTEKDMVKIKPLLADFPDKQHLFYYLPIQIGFDANQKKQFDELILNHCQMPIS
ncbi:tetraacyldisaccharide 4'-kinase [Flectobacillus longus]|uniref:tetraacyldisaccharide 4'-kinase n=1 Tax=Flectobacillus longus TaxID=2984207 RepID=UPI0024B84718|nr:tetraacyldisaccharide 4'-kinase [Flectobacillus longus]MDI9878073.1 tetraacyldisaccharide 4'-kinase [Flectobacillus longus]